VPARFFQAPCTGERRAARGQTGTLAIWVGGDHDVFERHEAVLVTGDQVRNVGLIGRPVKSGLTARAAQIIDATFSSPIRRASARTSRF
jgi:3-hydroxyisobutyrate dehydrogenase-like beta-hydroxyacid dehydrogenase